MTTITYPGEVVIDALVLAGIRGGMWDMSLALINATIFESIFKPGIYAEFKVLDVDDALGDLQLTGGERVVFMFRTADESAASYVFAINSVTLTQSKEANMQKSRTYTIECISVEVQQSRQGPIQKKWTAQISTAISDIFKNFLGSSKSLEVSQTKGVQELRISNKKPLTSIDELRRRATGFMGNTFLFWENRDGYHFKPLEEMLAGDAVKSLKQSGTVGGGGGGGSTQSKELDEQILHYTIIAKLNVEAAVKSGALSTEVITFNQRTREKARKIITPTMSSISPVLGALMTLFPKVGRSISIPITSLFPITGIPSATPEQAATASGLLQLIVLVQTFGDTVFQAGKNVDLTIPRPVAITTDPGQDQIVNGKFLITKVRHEIAAQGFQPRYQCVLECAQG